MLVDILYLQIKYLVKYVLKVCMDEYSKLTFPSGGYMALLYD